MFFSVMSVRSAVAGTASVGVLVGVLGSPAVVNGAQDLAERHHGPITAGTLTGFPNWDVFGDGTPTNAIWGVVLELGVLLILAGLLTAMAGGASRPAAFLAGWGSLVVAAGIAGAVHFTYQNAVLGPGENPFGVSYFDRLLSAANAGAAFGLWTGWLVGTAVAATARLPERVTRVTVPERVPTGHIVRSPGRAPITPPAPWWAADASPLSPVAYHAPSVFRAAAEHSTVADAEASAPRAAALDSTLATPLARVAQDADATRPIPAVTATDPSEMPDPTLADATMVEPLADATMVEPLADATVVEPLADPTVVEPLADPTVVEPLVDPTVVDPG
jgi:hypothetical protein